MLILVKNFFSVLRYISAIIIAVDRRKVARRNFRVRGFQRTPKIISSFSVISMWTKVYKPDNARIIISFAISIMSKIFRRIISAEILSMFYEICKNRRHGFIYFIFVSKSIFSRLNYRISPSFWELSNSIFLAKITSYSSFLARITCARYCNRAQIATRINFDKKTWRYRGNFRGVQRAGKKKYVD